MPRNIFDVFFKGIKMILNEELKKSFRRAVKNTQTIFVFNTETAKNIWAEWCVKNPLESGLKAVDLERFTTWDKFKTDYFQSKKTGQKINAIPPLVRKFFAATLIAENSKNPFLTSLIQQKYAKNSFQFTNWISSLLPSLELWNTKFESYKKRHPDYKDDGEDLDYAELYKRYSAFLKGSDFYDPLWAEKEFIPNGKSFVIFGANLVQDFADYENLIKGRQDVLLIKSGNALKNKEDESSKFKCLKFPDSRTELRRVLLKVRELSMDTDLSDIALVVPQLELYAPYIERECKRYCIPCSIKSGKTLSKYSGGKIFYLFKNCLDSDFTFESVRSLLSDTAVPWKEEEKKVRENLISKGSQFRCICNYEEKDEDGNVLRIDVWEEALSDASCTEELEYYIRIRESVKSICMSRNFEEIEENWKNFKSSFLGENPVFEEEVDLVVSRCIVLLQELSDFQNEYEEKLNLLIFNPYDFFLSELDSKNYALQNSNKNSLNVLKYKLSACAPYKYQFVIDSSQSNLDSPNKRLSFLAEKKRSDFGIADEDSESDCTLSYVNSYGENSGECFFSYAEDSFAGFAICHNALDVCREKNPWLNLDEKDFNKRFANLILKKDEENVCKEFFATKNMADSFRVWADTKCGFFDLQKIRAFDDCIVQKINELLVTNRSSRNFADKKINLTQSDMKNFFPCPRVWLFKNVLKIQEEKLQTDLIGPYDMGDLTHKILELFMTGFKDDSRALPVLADSGIFAQEKKISSFVDECIEKAFSCDEFSFMKIPLVNKNFRRQKEKFNGTIMSFLHELCKESKFGGWTPVKVEEYLPKVYGCKGAAGTKDFYEWNYTGRFDCLLKKDGRYAVIDFKNTENAVPKAKDVFVDEKGLLGDFQMPIYVALADSNAGKEALSKDTSSKESHYVDYAAFYSVRKNSKGKILERMVLKKEEQDSKNKKSSAESFYSITMQTLNSYAAKFTELVQNKTIFPLTKNEDEPFVTILPEDDCKTCAYNSLCRYNFCIAPSVLKTNF